MSVCIFVLMRMVFCNDLCTALDALLDRAFECFAEYLKAQLFLDLSLDLIKRNRVVFFLNIYLFPVESTIYFKIT